MDLGEREWKSYTIRDLFITKNNLGQQVPTGTYIPKKELKSGTMPRITVTSQNNGIDGYYEYNEKMQTAKNFISVSFLSTTFYHPYEASLDMKVHALQLKDRELNRFIAHFIISSLKESISDSSYGNQLSSTDIVRKTILLPAKEDGTPDYDFMESYVRGLEQKKRANYRKYAERQLALLKQRERVEAEPEWQAFYITDVFSIHASRSSIDKKNLVYGDNATTPYITRSDCNNGIQFYVSEQPKPLDNGNVITVGLDTQTVFYQPKPFYTGQNIQVFENSNLTKYSAMFIIPIIKIQMEKFNWGGNGATLGRLKRTKIMLPSKNGEPDFEYMSNYAKSLMAEKYEKYIAYASSLAV